MTRARKAARQLQNGVFSFASVLLLVCFLSNELPDPPDMSGVSQVTPPKPKDGKGIAPKGVRLAAADEPEERYGVPRTGRICIEDNGWTSFNASLPLIAQRLRDNGIANVVTWDECNPYNPSDRVVDITYANTTEAYCARVESGGWKLVGTEWFRVAPSIRVNMGQKAGCWATVAMQQHVLFHEVGHAFKLIHADGPGVMSSWDYSQYTPDDYLTLRQQGYNDLL